jgi:hypothetical protein
VIDTVLVERYIPVRRYSTKRPTGPCELSDLEWPPSNSRLRTTPVASISRWGPNPGRACQCRPRSFHRVLPRVRSSVSGIGFQCVVLIERLRAPTPAKKARATADPEISLGIGDEVVKVARTIESLDAACGRFHHTAERSRQRGVLTEPDGAVAVLQKPASAVSLGRVVCERAILPSTQAAVGRYPQTAVPRSQQISPTGGGQPLSAFGAPGNKPDAVKSEQFGSR